ncbi:single-stranded DNA-binding protein [Lactobacillaceae bacterium 24-114]
MSINASIVGRLTRNPEFRQTHNGTQVVSFTVAVDSTRKGRDNNYLTSFVRVTVWGNRGNFVLDHFMQGDPVSVAGELMLNQYQDRDGNNRSSLEMTADRIEFVPQMPRNRQPQTNGQNQPQGNYQNSPQQAPQGSQQQYSGNPPQNNQSGSQQPQSPNNGYQNNPGQFDGGQSIEIDNDQLPF